MGEQQNGEKGGQRGCRTQDRVSTLCSGCKEEDLLHRGRHPSQKARSYTFVRWPKYVRLQRSKMTLLKRIKIPPAINQFSNSFDKRQASQLFRLLNNLKPETKTEKKARRNEAADAVAAGQSASAKKPVAVKMGINH